MPISEIKKFWNWFEKNSYKYFILEGDLQILFTELAGKLHEINKNLVFEFSQSKNPREFIIGAGGIKEAFPIVTKLIEVAPKIDNLKIIGFKQPKPLPQDACIKIMDLKISLSDFYFIPLENEEEMGIDVYVKNFEQNNKAYISAGFIFLDSLVGEYNVGTYISSINFFPYSDDPDILPLTALPNVLKQYLAHIN